MKATTIIRIAFALALFVLLFSFSGDVAPLANALCYRHPSAGKASSSWCPSRFFLAPKVWLAQVAKVARSEVERATVDAAAPPA